MGSKPEAGGAAACGRAQTPGRAQRGEAASKIWPVVLAPPRPRPLVQPVHRVDATRFRWSAPRGPCPLQRRRTSAIPFRGPSGLTRPNLYISRARRIPRGPALKSGRRSKVGVCPRARGPGGELLLVSGIPRPGPSAVATTGRKLQPRDRGPASQSAVAGPSAIYLVGAATVRRAPSRAALNAERIHR